MDMFTILNRMDRFGDEIRSINEQLKHINLMIFGGEFVTDRPFDPPQPQPETPATKTSAVNLAGGFAYQSERLAYYTEYAREMVKSLETFIEQQPEGGAGAPVKSFPNRGRG